MKLNKKELLLVCVTVFLMLFNCNLGGWKQIGTVDVKNAITPEELWERREELIGKNVTLKLGKTFPSGTRGDNYLKGWKYYAKIEHIHLPVMPNKEHKKELNKKFISIKNQYPDSTPYNGYFDLNIMIGINQIFPKWLEDTSKILISDVIRGNKFDIALKRSYYNSNTKYFTGRFLNFQRNYNNEQFSVETQQREISFLSVGYRWKPKSDNN